MMGGSVTFVPVVRSAMSAPVKRAHDHATDVYATTGDATHVACDGNWIAFLFPPHPDGLRLLLVFDGADDGDPEEIEVEHEEMPELDGTGSFTVECWSTLV